MVRAYQKACAEVIQRLRRVLRQYLGKSLLVYFQPSPGAWTRSQAVRCDQDGRGHGDVEYAPGAGYGVRLAGRLGIHTGLVVVGEISSGGRREQLALETPFCWPQLQEPPAARIQS